MLWRRPEPFEPINADEIARRLGNAAGERARDLLAGRRMVRLLDELTAERRDIALETTLATLSHAHRIDRDPPSSSMEEGSGMVVWPLGWGRGSAGS